ncbi:MAG TPA: hypothetical protein PKI32_09535, partial [Opitutales bacterium]|nr:hypothetical protein [Opitutales bacterium]
FPFAWEERDKLKITYPDTFEIEQNDAPKSIIDTPALAYVVQLGRAKSRPTLVYSRLQKINVLNLPVKQYENIKTIFEAINTEDHHVITLRRKSEPVPGGNATAAPVANP